MECNAGRVIKKDPSHPGAVVVRFTEDGSRFWLPVDSVNQWLQVIHMRIRPCNHTYRGIVCRDSACCMPVHCANHCCVGASRRGTGMGCPTPLGMQLRCLLQRFWQASAAVGGDPQPR